MYIYICICKLYIFERKIKRQRDRESERQTIIFSRSDAPPRLTPPNSSPVLPLGAFAPAGTPPEVDGQIDGEKSGPDPKPEAAEHAYGASGWGALQNAIREVWLPPVLSHRKRL